MVVAMTAMICRLPGSYLQPRGSSHDLTSADSQRTKPQIAKPPQVVSSPVLSHSVAEKPKLDPNLSASSSSLSRGTSLPLPLPIPLTFPLPRSVFPSPLKFLWFNRENGLENESQAKVAQEEGQGSSDILSLTSAPSLRDKEGNSDLEISIEEGECEETGTGSILKEEDNDTNGGGEKPTRWVPNLVNLTYLWRKYRIDFPRSSGEEYVPPTKLPGNCTECGCETCGSDHYLQSEVTLKKSVMSFEVPVVHDKGNFGKFLYRMHYSELKFIARMAWLANQAYYIPELKKDELGKHYRLQFVTSSLERKAILAAKEKAALDEKEKLAVSSEKTSTADSKLLKKTSGLENKDNDRKESSLGPAQAYAMAATAASYLAYQTKSFLPFKSSTVEQKDLRQGFQQLENNQFKSAESETEDNPINPAGEENHHDCRIETDRLFAVDKEKAEDEADVDIPHLKDLECSNGNAESGSDTLAPVQTVASATGLVLAEDNTKDAVAKVLQSDAWCPSEWFVCDEEGTSKRYFVIQGSDSLASWQANLLFESSFFEDPEWGVMVHRGMYEAAKGLYEQLMPLIKAHVDAHGDKAEFYFTGHSLGGSLATLLTLMLCHRGVLPVSAMLPVYTFGSPSIMCGGEWLLEKLGFPLSHIQSVVMHFDIVPRTFACHYPDQVVEVLKRLNGTFRKHACLQHQKLMYAPMGKMLILQPDQQQAPSHPLLPTGSALYQVRHPDHGIFEDSIVDPHSPATAQAKEVRSAERSFLNSPHPLEILSDPNSYGSDGTISRDHDSVSYLRAVNTALKEEFKKWRRLEREKRRQLWGPLLSRSKSGKRLYKPLAERNSTSESGAIASERTKLRRSVSFLSPEETGKKEDATADSQMEPLSR